MRFIDTKLHGHCRLLSMHAIMKAYLRIQQQVKCFQQGCHFRENRQQLGCQFQEKWQQQGSHFQEKWQQQGSHFQESCCWRWRGYHLKQGWYWNPLQLESQSHLDQLQEKH